MARLNYGLALSTKGDWQVISTTHLPGIRDDFSIIHSEPFTYLVAPAHWVDKELHIHNLSGDHYSKIRQEIITWHPEKIKNLITAYHKWIPKESKPTWADSDEYFTPTRTHDDDKDF